MPRLRRIREAGYAGCVKKSIVSIVRCADYSPANVRAAVERAVEMAELEMPSGSRVLLKPNLLSDRVPEDACTTHPEVVIAAGGLARAAGCEVRLGDSPPFIGRSAAGYGRLCRRTGMLEAADSVGAGIVSFDAGSMEITAPRAVLYKRWIVTDEMQWADVLVNLPKMKTHGYTAMTGAVKNVFGCVPGARKALVHAQAGTEPLVFAQALVDLFTAISPKVNVMDAVVAMAGSGPNAGRPKEVGLILASADAVALDATACRVVGLDPFTVDMLRLASEQDAGVADESLIEVRGERVEGVMVEGFEVPRSPDFWQRIPGPLRNALRSRITPTPQFSAARCVGCGRCAEGCPVKAIAPGQPPSLQRDACIRCYCCQEVCDYSAVSLKRGFLSRMLAGKRS